MICSGNSSWLVPNLGILFHNRKPHPPDFALASTASSILCSLLNTSWRFSAARCPTALLATAWTDYLTGSPRSSQKRANSARPNNGQRLAGKGDLSGQILNLGHKCPPCCDLQRIEASGEVPLDENHTARSRRGGSPTIATGWPCGQSRRPLPSELPFLS